MDVTPLSLSIETLGGVSTCLIKRNSTIPTRYSKIFTTAVPYQSSVDIHVLQGERPMAKDNKTIGKFRLKGIRKAMAGVPQIEVTFDIDVNGILKVSAKDLDTGKAQSITITAGDRMSDAEIEQAMQDAREYAGQDQLRRDALELIGDAQKAAVQARRVLKEQDKIMDKARKKQLKKDVSVLEKALSKIRVDKVSEEDMAGVRSAMQDRRCRTWRRSAAVKREYKERESCLSDSLSFLCSIDQFDRFVKPLPEDILPSILSLLFPVF